MPDDAAAARKARRQARRLARGDASSFRHGARNEGRAAEVVRWLIAQFGIDKLRTEGVIDIGGGRGELCARLAHCHEIPCLLIDECHLSLDAVQHILKTRVAPKLPRVYREKIVAADRSARIDRLVRICHGTFPSGVELPAEGILIGLHADGATEAIVDVALHQHMSFAVVPCCVLRHLFMPTQPPNAHAELCDHLQAKAADIKRHVFDFPGRNVCLYRKTVRTLNGKNVAPVMQAQLQAQSLNHPLMVRTWWLPTRNPRLLSFVRDDSPNLDELKIDGWPRYLKDWHARRDIGDYGEPPGFENDWLGDWIEGDDFDFCYVGPAGSETDWHVDVLSTFSWSVNLCGVKQWQFADGSVATQHTSDVIFVPADLKHRVVNTTAALSINRNWFNQYNIHSVVDHLAEQREHIWRDVIQPTLPDFQRRAATEHEIRWTLETVLRANARLNFSDLLSLLQSHLHELPPSLCSRLLHVPLLDGSVFLHPDTGRFPTQDHPDSWGEHARATAQSAVDRLKAALQADSPPPSDGSLCDAHGLGE